MRRCSILCLAFILWSLGHPAPARAREYNRLVPPVPYRPLQPHEIINPPEWNVTNSLTNTVPVYIAESGGSVLFYTTSVIYIQYGYTNTPAPPITMWIDIFSYPYGLTIVDRRGRVKVRDAMPPEVGPSYLVADYDGKFVLILSRDGAAYTLHLYRLRRKGLKHLGSRPIDFEFAYFSGEGPRLQNGKVLNTPLTIDLSVFGFTSLMECYNRRLDKVLWSRPPGPGMYASARVGGRRFPAYPNGYACLVDLFGAVYAWRVSKQGTLVYTHTTGLTTTSLFSLVFGPDGSTLFWSNNGTYSSPTNSPVTYVGRKGVRTLTLPELGNANWDGAAYDGKYFITERVTPPHDMRCYSIKGVPRLRGMRTISNARRVFLDGARAYVLIAFAGYEGASVYTTSLKKEKWQIPAAQGLLEYLDHGVFLRETVNTSTVPARMTLTFIKKNGVFAEHTFDAPQALFPIFTDAQSGAPRLNHRINTFKEHHATHRVLSPRRRSRAGSGH